MGLPIGREEGKEQVFRAKKESGPSKCPGESPEVDQRWVGQRIEVCQEEGKEERVKGFYGVGAELDAYVSRGILVCPDVGDRAVLDRSRLRMTAVFHREGPRSQGILL